MRCTSATAAASPASLWPAARICPGARRVDEVRLPRDGARHKEGREDGRGHHLGIAAQLRDEPALRRDDRRVVDPVGAMRVDHHLLRRERARPQRLLHDLQAARGLGRDRDPAVVAARQVQIGGRQRQRDQHRGREAAPHEGPAHDRHREAVPAAGHVLGRAALEDAARDHAEAVHAAAHHRQEGRQEGGRRDDRDDRDEHAAHAHRAHERQRHEHEQAEADRHGQAREKRRAPGRAHRRDQGGVRVVVALELLAIAEDDEHRVVDRDREADQRDDVVT